MIPMLRCISHFLSNCLQDNQSEGIGFIFVGWFLVLCFLFFLI